MHWNCTGIDPKIIDTLWKIMNRLARNEIRPHNCIQTNRILNVQIVVGHSYVGMTNQALDCSKIYTQGLHLGNIGMSAAMRS